MDKETLSNYGWVVICVLVLVVMIALATPFGSFVSQAVQSTTKGLFDVNKSALDSTGLINIDDQEFENANLNIANPPSKPDVEDGMVKNEYGFYYDVVYYGELRDDGSDFGHSYVKDYALVFKENGDVWIFEDTIAPATVALNGNFTYTVSNGIITLSDGVQLKIMDDGNGLEYHEAWEVYFGNITKTEIIPSGANFGETYEAAWNENETFVFHNNNTVTVTYNGVSRTYDVNWKTPYLAETSGLGVLQLSLEYNKVYYAPL